MKKKAVALVLLIALFVCTASGCSGLKENHSESEDSKTTENEDTVASDKEEPEVFHHNEEETSNLGLWTRAAGSVLIYLNDGNPYYFGGYQKTDENAKAAKSILASSWGIESRQDLLRQIKQLIKTGDRKEYKKEAKEMKAMSKEDLNTALSELSGDLLIHYQMVRYNWKTWKKRGLIAWDMCRVSHLVQWGCVAGYVDEKEAQALMEPAAEMLKENFDCWEDVQNNWLDGYCLYACIDREKQHTEYTNRLALYETLRAEQSENDLLYDDSLFAQDIIPIEGVSYDVLMEEIKEEKKEKDSQEKEEEEKENQEPEQSADSE